MQIFMIVLFLFLILVLPILFIIQGMLRYYFPRRYLDSILVPDELIDFEDRIKYIRKDGKVMMIVGAICLFLAGIM